MKIPRKIWHTLWLLFFVLAGFYFWRNLTASNLTDPTLVFDDTHIAECFGFDKLAGWGFKPGCKNRASRAGHAFDFRINQEGIRGPDYPPRPPKGTKRIFLVGSSIFFAPGLQENQSSAAVLEKYFREAGEKVEVLNVSTEGYSALQLFLRLKQWTAAYHPDIVLFNLSTQHLMVDQVLASLYSVSAAPNSLPESVYFDPAHILPPGIYAELIKWDSIHRVASAAVYFYYRWKISWRFVFAANNAEAEVKWANISVEAMRRLQQMSVQQHFKLFIFSLSAQEDSNFVSVNPNLSFRTAEFFNFFTPDVSIPVVSIFRILGESRLPYFVIDPQGTEKAHLPNDYHLSEFGAKWMADQLFAKREVYFPAKKTK